MFSLAYSLGGTVHPGEKVTATGVREDLIAATVKRQRDERLCLARFDFLFWPRTPDCGMVLPTLKVVGLCLSVSLETPLQIYTDVCFHNDPHPVMLTTNINHLGTLRTLSSLRMSRS